MIPAYMSKLGFKVITTNIIAQKIDSSIFQIFQIVYTSFHVKNKLERLDFSKKSF